MRRIAYGMAALLVTAAAGSVAAQKTIEVHPGKGGSPHVRTEYTIDGAGISVEYGRPYLKGRPEDGPGFMEIGKPWRTGADEATLLKTDKPLKFGTLSLEPGTYTLNTQPGEKEWQLIVSKATGQWGIPYPAGQDLGRTPMKVGKTASAVEQLTISIDDTAQGGTLRVEWGNTSASVPFTVGQ